MLPVAGTVLRGNIDLLGDGRGRRAASSIDYKTDRVGARRPPAALGERYAAQRAVYALAAAGGEARRARGARLSRAPGRAGGRGSSTPPGLEAARARLEGLVEQIRAGVVRARGRALRRALLRVPRGPPPVPPSGVAPAPRRPGGASMSRLAVFGYGSLVSPASVARDARPRRGPAGPGAAARLAAALVARPRQRRAEKGFEPIDGDPFDFCLGLNLERAPDPAEHEWPNGALIEMTDGRARPARPARASLRPGRRDGRRRERRARLRRGLHLHREAGELRAASSAPRGRARLLPARVRGGLRRAGAGELVAFARTTERGPGRRWSRRGWSATRSRRATRGPGSAR